MRRGDVIVRGIAFAVAALALAPAGLAADPRGIAKDLEDGRLDGRYSAAELRSFLNDATVQGYGNPVVQASGGVAGEQKTIQAPKAKRPAAKQQPTSQPSSGVAGEQSPLRVTGRQGALPFTGIDLALMTAGGMALLGLGIAMRKFAREHG